MALKTESPKALKILDTSGAAAVDLSGSIDRVVAYTASVTSGKPTFSLPSGQGVITAGVLLNAPAAIGNLAEVRQIGLVKIEAASTFNAGVEVTVSGATGVIEAAASGDYVIGISQEAALEAGHKVSVLLSGAPYQKN